MKDKPNEWVAISDLMAGVMAVVMLLLVMSVLQKSYSDIQHKKELAKQVAGRVSPVTNLLNRVNAQFSQQQVTGLFSVDVNAGRITMKENIFAKGSACVTEVAIDALKSVDALASEFLKNNINGRIYVEGYTDNIPVKSPVTNFEKNCTVYDDNYTLSAARAREARRYLIGNFDETLAKRVIVAGYGESRPIAGFDASDPRNRRVEVLFTTESVSR